MVMGNRKRKEGVERCEIIEENEWMGLSYRCGGGYANLEVETVDNQNVYKMQNVM